MPVVPRKKRPSRRGGSQVPRAAASRRLYVLSDSTGNLARHMLSAFQTQFPPEALSIRVEPFLRTLSNLKDVLLQAQEERAAVCHAMVSEKFKAHIFRHCRDHGLPCCDLTGGIVAFLSKVAKTKPRCDVQSLHRIDEAYRRRIGALEYTISHDDGLGLETLYQADAVLVGASRTSKTPTSIYLAQQGYRIANVSLALGIAPPEQLLALQGERVVGLHIDPQHLFLIRQRRQSTLGIQNLNYGEPDQVERELVWTRRLFSAQGWKCIDVTDQAIEETAAHVLKHIATAGPSSAENPQIELE